MSTSAEPDDEKPRAVRWVDNVDGKPVIRWGAIWPVAAIVTAQLSVMMVVARPPPSRPGFHVPFLGLLFAYELLAILAIGVVYVELQRQKILSGKFRPQLGLGATMVLVALAAVLSALLGYEYRTHRFYHDAFAMEQKQKAEWKKMVAEMSAVAAGATGRTGTNTVIDWSNGTRVICYVDRKDFTNEDLAALIGRSTRDGRECPIEELHLSNTQIDNAGLRMIARCPHLRKVTVTRAIIDPPWIEDESLDAIIEGCVELQSVLIWEHHFKPGQIERLRERMPDLKFNGKTWKERGRESRPITNSDSQEGEPTGILK